MKPFLRATDRAPLAPVGWTATPAGTWDGKTVDVVYDPRRHDVLFLRKDLPFNEVRRGAEASLITSMGRMAAHTGQVITRDEMLNCEHEFAPNVDTLTNDSPAPLLKGEDGKYPVPQPGIKTTREY